MQIPKRGKSREELLTTMRQLKTEDLDWRSGRTFGYVYNAGDEADQIAKEAATMFMSENALDPTSFPSLLRFENELVSMAREHLRGDADVVGNFTSGGTESILLAVKCARDWARANKPEIKQPEMIVPVTAHAAFHKAAAYFDVSVVPTPIDPSTYRADAAAVEQHITENTILLVGSAPSYAHGVIDPIVELGALAKAYDLLFHVDACVGGFLLPYYRRLGEPVPDFDFAVDGVTSISLDVHKYGYAPKGSSLLLYRHKNIRRYQYFSCAEWTGYSMVNATIQSTKSGGPLAAAWAVMNFIGDDGYLELARRVRDTTNRIIDGINAIDDLYVMGTPEMSLIAFASDSVSVFGIVDEMKLRGWYVQPQLAFGGSKENIHLTVAPGNDATVDAFLSDLRASVEAARGLQKSEMAQTIGQSFGSLTASDINPEVLSQMLAMAGVQGTDLPERMAEINEVLNALPAGVCERLLTEFLGDLYSEQALPGG